MGPKPNMGIDRSQQATEEHETRRISTMATKATLSLSQTEFDPCEVSQFLSKTLVDYGRKDVLSEHNTSNNYQCFKVSPTLYYVRRSHWSELDTNPESEEYWKCMVPRFDRTRSVTLHEGK